MTGIVIVGANAAGLGAAEGARDVGYEGPILLLDEDDDALLQRPPLSKEVLSTGAAPPPLIEMAALEALRLDIRLGEPVVALDPTARAVHLPSGIIKGEAVILCTGAAPRTDPRLLPLGDRCLTLRSLSDALELRARIMTATRIVVVGGGLIGLEIAASARTAGCEVVVLETQPVPARRAFGVECGTMLAAIHRERGVDLRCGVEMAQAARIPRGVRVELLDGATVSADFAVAALGAAPREQLALDAGLAVRDGILVDAHGRTSARGIFAAGDAARLEHDGGSTRCENLQHAMLHGRAVGRAAAGGTTPYGEVPWYWSDQYGHSIQACGRIEGPPAIVRRGGAGLLAIWIEDEALTGAVAIDGGAEIAAARRLISRGRPLDVAALHGGETLRSIARADKVTEEKRP